MKIGIVYPQTELHGDPEAVRRIAVAAEEIGYDHLLAYDHVLGAHTDRGAGQGPYNEKHPFHDPLVMFAHVAAITRRIELVTGVIILPQRQTALVARQAADVDLLSGERLRLGVGIGWNQMEYEALGQDFHRRGKRIAEQVGLLRELWSSTRVDFTGAFDRIDRAVLNPRPKRRIPIWMGGSSDPALRRAAGIADGFIFTDGATDPFINLPRLRTFLEAEDRDPASFGLQINLASANGIEAVVDRALRWRDEGGSHAAVVTMGHRLHTIDEHVDFMRRAADALRAADVF